MVVRVNINGLRKKKKRGLLGKLMLDLWTGVCVVTETHIRKEELGRAQIDNYHILADDCRATSIGEHIGGEVIILVHNALAAAKEDEIPGLAPQAEHCAITLHLSNQVAKTVRLSGVYLPPLGAAATKRKSMDTILAAGSTREQEEKPAHLIAGDLNISSWMATYTKWLHEEGLAELTNSIRPTFAAGSSLDKFLLRPAVYVLPSLLPTPRQTLREELHDGETLHFPGAIADCSHICDHISIVLPLAYNPPQLPRGERN